MPSILTKDFGVFAAETFETSISNGTDFVYAVMGRSVAWPNSDTPETPYDTTDYKNSVFKNGIIMKKITGSDVQLVVPRVNWTSGTLYTAYDHTANLYSTTKATEVANCTVNVGVGTPRQVNANSGFDFTTQSNFSVGDIIRIDIVDKEIVSVNAEGDFLTVNTAYDSAYTVEICYEVNTVTPDFYVRNNLDQVFKCLYNNNNTNSTYMPEITLGGELPENPYIQTADGYKWKYLYTIPSGLKKKFFTTNYMPVLRDTVVFNNTENGRLDIIQVTDGGDGYYNGANVTNYAVATVVGDGAGANVTVDIVNGVITEVNIVDGGSDYTTATIALEDPLQLASSNAATLRAVISPQYGHGSDPARELGASYAMISVDFTATVEGNLPTPTASDDFRQIVLLRNPRLANDGTTAIQSIYPMYTKLFVENRTTFVPDANLIVDDTNFTSTVLFYDTAEDSLYVNNVQGDANTILTLPIKQENDHTIYAQVYTVEKPSINISSGEILYIENSAVITRDANQTETAKIVIEF
jgi:hypothetical protein